MTNPDTWLIAKAEKASHAVQRFCGATSYRQIVWCMRLVILACGTHVADFWLQSLIVEVSDVKDAVFGCVAVAVGGLVSMAAARADERFGSDVMPASAISLQTISDAFLRGAYLGFSILSVLFMVFRALRWQFVDAFVESDSIWLCAALYLAHVKPLPRGPSKVEAFVESLRPAPTPVEVR